MALALICVILMAQPNREYLYEGSVRFQEGNAVCDYPVFEGICLSPGVYRMELTYSCDTDMQSMCWPEDGNVITNGLLSHGEQLYSGLSHTDFHMWLFENTDTLRVLVKYDGQGGLWTGNLRIYETDQLWGICLTGIVTLTVLLLAVRLLLWWDRQYGISRENKNVLFLLIILTVVSSAPFCMGMTTAGGDLTYHLQRIEGIKDGILSGQFPVRLEPEWVHGHGYANGVFYCGTLLLFPALLRIVGFPVTFSYNCYVVALNALTVWISWYSFSRIFKSNYIGVAGSALYTLSMYRLYKLVIISAVGESSSFAFLPLVVYGFWRVFTEDTQDKRYRRRWIPLAFGYAGIFQTHVLSCEITVFLTLLLCIVYRKKIFRLEILRELCKGVGTALALSLWFLVPFLDYYIREDLCIKHGYARPIQERGLYLAQLLAHWWRIGSDAPIGESGMYHSHALGVGFILIAGFLVFGGLWFFGRFGGMDKRIFKLGRLSFVFSTLLMCMSLNLFPWDKIQNSSRLLASLVGSLQFPNRFLGWASVFLVLLFCSCLYYFREKEQKTLYYAGLLCVLTGIATSSLYLTDYAVRDRGQLTLYNEEGMGKGYIAGGEYLAWGTRQETLVYHAPAASKGVLLEAYEKGALCADFRCVNPGNQEGYVELPLLHYYGYQAYAEGMRLSVCKGDNNLVRVIIPAGLDAQVKVRLFSPWYWRAAEIVSYMTLLYLPATYIIRRMAEKCRGKEEE